MKQLLMASQLENSGRIEEAILRYRNALAANSNNPAILNNLAWILATTAKPELRNGGEAVELAARAVRLTDYREPAFLGTLAAAYAEIGHFSDAYQTALIARVLAIRTGRNDFAENTFALMQLYSVGKTAGALRNP